MNYIYIIKKDLECSLVYVYTYVKINIIELFAQYSLLLKRITIGNS